MAESLLSRQQLRARDRAVSKLSESQIEAEMTREAQERAQRNFQLEQACAQRASLALQALSANIGESAEVNEIKRLSKEFVTKFLGKALLMVELIDYSGLQPDDEGGDDAPQPGDNAGGD